MDASSIPMKPAAAATSLRDRRRQRVREEIMASARAAILEVGPERASLRDVARRADYSPAALYKYFDSKDALLAAVGMEAIQLLGAYMSRVPESLPPARRLVELGMAYVAFAEENREQFTLAFNRLTVPEASWPEYVKVAWPFTVLIEAVAQAARAGELKIPKGLRPEDVAFGLWSLAHGAASLQSAHLKEIRDDLRPLVRAAMEAQLAGLGGTAPGRRSKSKGGKG